MLVADHAYLTGTFAVGAVLPNALVSSGELDSLFAVTSGTSAHVTLRVLSHVRNHLGQLTAHLEQGHMAHVICIDGLGLVEADIEFAQQCRETAAGVGRVGEG